MAAAESIAEEGADAARGGTAEAVAPEVMAMEAPSAPEPITLPDRIVDAARTKNGRAELASGNGPAPEAWGPTARS